MDKCKGFYSYVRRLGQWHLMSIENPSVTLCEMPMLSANRGDFIPIEEREKCNKCFQKADLINKRKGN